MLGDQATLWLVTKYIHGPFDPCLSQSLEPNRVSVGYCGGDLLSGREFLAIGLALCLDGQRQPSAPGKYLGVNDGFNEGKVVNGRPREDREDPDIRNAQSIAVTGDLVPLNLSIFGQDFADWYNTWWVELCGSLDSRVTVQLTPRWQGSGDPPIRIHAIKWVDGPPGQHLWQEVQTTHNALWFVRNGCQMYVEGCRPGGLHIEARGRIDRDPYRERQANAYLTVVQIDADVDSDNTKTEAPFGPDGSIEEDRIEDRDDLPGRIVLVNDDDDDNDGVVDYGDGYNLMSEDEAFQDDIAHGENDFIEMKLRVPAPVDLAVARIRVTYQASDPSLATYEYSPSPPYSITPAPGLLRIWTTTGSECRFRWSPPGGDYVAPDTYPASALGLSNGTREVSLWLEGINPGQTQVVFELDPDGDAGPAGFVHSDAFRVTVLKVAIVNPTGPSWVYDSSMGQKTPRIMTPANAPLFSGNEFTYSDAYPDGVLTLPVYVVVEPNTQQIQALFENKIRARVSAIDDSHSSHENVQLVWDHPFPGEPTAGNVVSVAPTLPLWLATATFTKLPPDNEDFGRKTLTVDFLGTAGNIVCSPRTRQYEVFFGGDDSTTNHPGQGIGVTPNWLFFWLKTSAAFGTPIYDPNEPNTTIRYQSGTWVAVLCPLNNDPYVLPSGDPNQGIQIDGIDAFAWACRHEGRHVQTSTMWYPQDYQGDLDADRDWMPDSQEPILGGTQQQPTNGGPFNPILMDTDGDGLRDDEDYTIATQSTWEIGSADNEDWSNPGHQSGR